MNDDLDAVVSDRDEQEKVLRAWASDLESAPRKLDERPGDELIAGALIDINEAISTFSKDHEKPCDCCEIPNGFMSWSHYSFTHLGSASYQLAEWLSVYGS